jgi:hypothetical protein
MFQLELTNDEKAYIFDFDNRLSEEDYLQQFLLESLEVADTHNIEHIIMLKLILKKYFGKVVK